MKVIGSGKLVFEITGIDDTYSWILIIFKKPEAIFHPTFGSIQSFNGCCDSSSPRAIIAWVSRVYVGLINSLAARSPPNNQPPLPHLRGGYF
jgi:hypothetical protein